MKYISLFSGIEAASVAWGPLDWEPVAFSEIEPFAKAVLAKHYPNVPDLGDITKIDWSQYVGEADVVVGGSPCQSFSVAGSRTGLKGASGLMWEYVRAVRELRPQWFVWENVPGALSSSHGEDFRCLLESMDELGYGLAWRSLDAQFFGVAQRRRRVFVVGHLGDRRAAEVLFEPESLRRDPPSSREKRKALARGAAGGIGDTGRSLTPWDVQTERVYQVDNVGPTLGSCHSSGGNHGPNIMTAAFSSGQSSASGSLAYAEELSTTLRDGYSGTNQVPAVYCRAGLQVNSEQCEDMSPALTTHGANDQNIVFAAKVSALVTHGLIRRLTPMECERLQGFQDGWTDIPWRGKDHAPDSPRYKALGNSMAVPVMRWIGERIEACDAE